MIALSLRRQQLIFVYLSLAISAWVLWLKISFLPHSLMYIIIYVMSPIFNKFSLPGLYSIPTTFGVFFTLFICSLVHGSSAFKQYKYKAFLPLIINILTVIAILFMQYAIVLPDFYANFKERETVIAQIISGQLIPEEPQRIQIPIPNHPYKIYNMMLPSKYAHLSKGREPDGEINILVDQKINKPIMVVFFNTFSRFRWEPNYTAFIYKTDSEQIRQQKLFGVGNLNYYIWLLEGQKIKNNWFWVDLFED
ncbi:MAG: hypothetical protein AB1589_11420 [Cyanobacteriota bacterium]